MRVAILQPTYWARTHIWNRILAADVFVWLDNVKFTRGSAKWEDRTVVETPDGRRVVLRLPLRGPRDVLWREAGLNDGWLKHRQTMQRCYGRRPYWKIVAPHLEPVYAPGASTIEAVCRRSFEAAASLLGVCPPLVRASDLPQQGTKGELVLQLVKAVGGTTYLTGEPGAAYLDPGRFAAEGVTVKVQRWTAPVTGHGLADPSIVHILAEVGPAESLRLLRAR